LDVARRRGSLCNSSREVTAGVQLLDWFAVGSELQRDWRDNAKGFGKILSDHTPIYRNLAASYEAKLK
jgi:hypothetical protein